MNSYRIGTRFVASFDVILSCLGLGRFWFNMDPIVWTDPFQVVVHCIIMEVLVLEFMAAMMLFAATLKNIPLASALKLCNFWRFFNATWICLEMFSVFLITLLVVMRVHVSFSDWIPVIIPVIQIEASLRLGGVYVVAHFMEKLKPVINPEPDTTEDIRLHRFPVPNLSAIQR